MIFEELDNLEPEWPKITVVGIEKLGAKVINELQNYQLKNLEYLFLFKDYFLDYSLSEKLLLNEENLLIIKDKLYKQDVVIFVGEINDNIDYNLILKLINENNKNKLFNLAFLNGNMLDKAFINNIGDNTTIFKDNNFELLVNTIKYIVGSIYIPGLIGMDIYDVQVVFKDIKEAFCYYNEGYNEITVIDDILYKIGDFNGINNMLVVIDSGINLSLKQVDNIIKRIRLKGSENINIICATQSFTDKNNISIALVHNKANDTNKPIYYKAENAVILEQNDESLQYQISCPHCGYLNDWLTATLNKANGAEEIYSKEECFKCKNSFMITFEKLIK